MIRLRYARIVLCFLFVFVSLSRGNTQSQQIDNHKQSTNIYVGKNDPFAPLIPNQESTIPQETKMAANTEEQSPELFVETVILKFLDAKSLESVIGSMSSEYGKISIDSKSNSLIICDTKDDLKKIVTQIKKADKTPQQIEIEVVIADIHLNDDTEVGMNWASLFQNDNALSLTQNLVTTLSTTGTLGADLAILKGGIAGTLHALQEVQNVEILANPRVLVLSGETAEIKTIEEIPYEEVSQTSEGGSLTSTKFKEVGVILKVKAVVMDDGKILMTIEPGQSAKTGESINDVPVVDSRQVKTTLLMEPDHIVVMAGLKNKNTTITNNKIPLLGDLPFVGMFFSDNKVQIADSELIVFISPHIHKNIQLSADEMAKFREITDRPMLTLPEDRETVKEFP